jgi:hypothetical protein
MARKNYPDTLSWLLFFYSVPSKPVSKRMKIWRKLMQSGALHLKGSVYVLPHSDEHEEMFSWLTAEVAGMGGEAAFVKTSRIETMRSEEIIALFEADRARAYEQAGKQLHTLEQKVGSARKGGKALASEQLLTEFRKIEKAFTDIRAVDFFNSEQGRSYAERLRTLSANLDAASHGTSVAKSADVALRNPADYRNRIWVTRSRPFVDRMASAWLIQRFIDPKARFAFLDDESKAAPARGVLFDVGGGTFTHQGDLCTFEVLIRAFALKQRPLRRIGEIVHELDVKDGRYNVPEARGIEELLTGIRKTATTDAEALDKGMAVFEMLYASRT